MPKPFKNKKVFTPLGRLRLTKGFTIAEILITVIIGVLFFGNVLAVWYFTVKFWAVERNKTQLRLEAEVAMERMKKELRLSSSTYMKYNPSEAPYYGISFPGATPDSNGFYTISSDEIVWGKTIIYHMWLNQDTGKLEVRRTVFEPRDNTISDADRQTQLDLIVANGSGDAAGIPNSQNATTETVFKDIEDYEVNTEYVRFDGYSGLVERSSSVSFGTARLSSGEHDITFHVTGKNANSTGYQLGIDYFSVTPSGCNREAEYYYPPYYTTGDSTSKENLSGWSGNYALSYSANAVGDFITLRFYYDAWVECNFQELIQVDPNVSVLGTDYAITLVGRDQGSTTGWFVVNQTESAAVDGAGIFNKSIRNIIYNSEISETANMVRFKFKASSAQPLSISSAYFGIRSSGPDADPSVYTQLFFDNAAVEEGSFEETAGTEGPGTNTSKVIPAGYYVWSNWVEYTIDPAQGYDYVVSIYIDSGGTYQGQQWTDAAPQVVQSYSVDGNYASTTDWPTLTDPDNPSVEEYYIYALSDVGFWKNTGNAVSQIYDTKITGNSYTEIKWTGSEPSGTDIQFKVRASDNDDMSGASDWSAISAISGTPSSVPGSGRYLQFQTILTNSSPYNNYPSVTDVRIKWPGQTRIVDIGGRFTKKPNYGIFKVLIDGVELLKTLEVNTEVKEKIQATPYYFKVNMEPRNTNLPE